jgi:hypothetical protein
VARKIFGSYRISVRKGVSQRLTTLLKRIDSRRLTLSSRVLNALKSADEKRTDFDLVSEVLNADCAADRISSAKCIEELANAWDGVSRYVLDNNTRERLIKALDHEVPEIQRNLTRALAQLHFIRFDEAQEILVRHLVHVNAGVQEAALMAIQSYGPDQASRLSKKIGRLFSNAIPAIQQEMCRVLVSFGKDAEDACPELLKELSVTDDASVRSHVVKALIAIDRDTSIIRQVNDDTTRNVLINELRLMGESGRDLRQLLGKHWMKDDPESTDPLPGFTLKQLATLFGCSEKTVKRKIDMRILPVESREGLIYRMNPLIVDLFSRGGGFGHKSATK